MKEFSYISFKGVKYYFTPFLFFCRIFRKTNYRSIFNNRNFILFSRDLTKQIT